MYDTIVDAVRAHAESAPDRLAIAMKRMTLTYGELYSRVRAAAGVLSHAYGVRGGDMVMLTAYSKAEYAVAFLALQYLHAVTVPVDKLAKPGSVYDLCDFIHPRLIITDAKLDESHGRLLSLKRLYAEMLEADGAAGPEYELPDMDALAEILFTTGTTGRPKGVMLTYGNIRANTRNMGEGIGMNAEDRILVPLPLNHSLGLRSFRLAMYVGAAVILQNGFAFERDLTSNLTGYGCTAMVSVPVTMEMLLNQMQDRFGEVFSGLRYIEIGSGSLAHDTKRRLLRLLPGAQLHNTWGSTETGGAIFLNFSEHPDKLTSIGRPLEGIDFMIVDECGKPVKARDIESAGRMILRGPMRMAGYYAAPELTAEAIVDGWLYTNDIAYQDEDGYVYMLGRADDIINVGGEKVSPLEIENAAQAFGQVRECACIGVKDPDGALGEYPVLFVVPADGALDEEQLSRFLSDSLEKYKLPRRYALIGELPRNRMLKLDRKALKRIWQEKYC